MCWAGQVRMVRKLERVSWTPLAAHGDPDTEARTRRMGARPAHATGRGHPVTDARPRRLVPNGPWSPVAATLIRSGYPDTDAQLRRLELSGPRPSVAATRMIKPGGPVTQDHGQVSSDPDGSPDSRLGLLDQAKALGICGPWTEHPGPVSPTNLSLYHRT